MRVRKRRKLDLGKTLFLLPNLITLSSIFCGFDAIRLAARGSEDDIYRAAVLLIFAMIFDMLDGRVARMTKTQSAFGVFGSRASTCSRPRRAARPPSLASTSLACPSRAQRAS